MVQVCRLHKTSCIPDGCLYKKRGIFSSHLHVAGARMLFRKKSAIAGRDCEQARRCAPKSLVQPGAITQVT